MLTAALVNNVFLAAERADGDGEGQHRAAGLLQFYYWRFRFKVPGGTGRLSGPGDKTFRRRRKLLLAQIRVYPLLKRLLAFILAAVIRRRFSRAKRLAQTLTVLWKRRGRSDGCLDAGEGEEDDSGDGRGCESEGEPSVQSMAADGGAYLCPSPVVLLRGTVITTPKTKRGGGGVKSLAGVPPLRVAPSFATPIKARTATRDLLIHQSEAYAAESPLATPSRPVREVDLRAAIRSTTSAVPKEIVSPIPMPPPQSLVATSAPRGKGPRRVLKRRVDDSAGAPVSSGVSASAAEGRPKRLVCEDLEWSRLTEKNTRANSGYKTCDLAYRDVVIPRERPESPSSKFSKTAAVAQRKWANIDQGRILTQRHWHALLNGERSPRVRRIRWHGEVHFIDDDVGGQEGEGTEQGHTQGSKLGGPLKGAMRDGVSLSQESPEKLVVQRSRQKILIQRIAYVPPAGTERASGARSKRA